MPPTGADQKGVVTPQGIVEIHVEHIKPNQRQPRTDFNEESIRGLASSIRQAGLMQPIVVRPAAQGYELIAGERRWRAAKLLGLRVIPALVRDLDDQTSAEFALIENVQREDLNPMDRAIALRRLSTDFGLTHQVIADRVGLDRASVTNLLRLSDLDTATAQLVRSGALSQGHGKALLALTDLSVRRAMAERTMKQDWSVRELERRIQHVQRPDGTTVTGGTPSRADKSPRSANAADLERKLAEHLGTRVAIQLGRKKGSGRLMLDFYSLDQFDGLMQRLGFDASRM
jgi:ParB family chromosome partitioning protein